MNTSIFIHFLKVIFIYILFTKCYVIMETITVDLNQNSSEVINIQKTDVKAKQLLLFSSLSAVSSSKDIIDEFLKKNNVSTLLFIPYAHFFYNSTATRYSYTINKIGYEIESIHTKKDPIEAIKNAEAIYIGGGNTFALLKTLYDQKLIEPIREQVLQNNIPYIGVSAGTNVATISIHTTNDMPIVYPPTFKALNFLPFNINPHFYHYDDRLIQFLLFNNATVLGMRNGNILLVTGNNIQLVGTENATLMQSYEEDYTDYESGSDLSFLSNLEAS